MNEYIIVTRNCTLFNGTPLKTLIPVNTIREFGRNASNEYTIIVSSQALSGNNEYHVKESPAEIEALIMGSITSSDPFNNEQVRRAFLSKYWDAKTEAYKKLDEKNAKLKEDIEKLKEENSALKDALSDTQKQLEIMVKYSKDKFHSVEHSNEENAKLKEQLETLKQRSEKWVGDINGLQFKNASLTASLNTSNPENPCCRETFENCRKLYLTDQKKAVPFPEAVKFSHLRDIWQKDFLKEILNNPIQENKNE